MSEPVSLRLMQLPQSTLNKLARLDLSYSTDLLRCSSVALRNAMAKSTTLDDVRQWQAIASVLEIEGMTLKWARALTARGIVSGRYLGQRTLSKAAALFADAKRSGEITAVPDSDQLVAMMLDAMRLRLSGVLNATVNDSGKKPVAGVRVRCAGTEGVTDKHGRVRLLRLPINTSVDVLLDKPGFVSQTTTVAALRGAQVREGQHFVLKRSSASTKIGAAKSELKGHMLPLHPGRRTRALEVHDRPLRRGDLLRCFELLKSGDAKLASLYKEEVDGEVIIPIWRLSAAELPAEMAVGKTFLVTADGLQVTTVTPHQLARKRIARQVGTQMPPLRKGDSRAQARKRLQASLKEYLRLTKNIRTLGIDNH